MNPLARRRIVAYALDATGYVGIAAAMIPLGLLARRAGWGDSQAFVISASAVPVLLATAIATRAEIRGGTWGKRRQALRVAAPDGAALSLGPALARNVLKIAIPWHLGHLVAIEGAFGGFDEPRPTLVVTTVATYLIIGVGLWGVLRRSGVTAYDAVAGSRVRPG
ncbi:RDD family protein [Georgenia deserti]|uniref:RDD family protein n=1 Tax=Georgenia deserti TaxID=2093781 RepID=A0ABW4L3J8_9MICO